MGNLETNQRIANAIGTDLTCHIIIRASIKVSVKKQVKDSNHMVTCFFPCMKPAQVLNHEPNTKEDAQTEKIQVEAGPLSPTGRVCMASSVSRKA